jgi:hypothetical protein
MKNEPGLLQWQLSNYPAAHTKRSNLVVHLLTVPVFMAGTLALALAWWSPWLLLGVAAMGLVMMLQGRGHSHEPSPPAPFRGPLDVIARIFAEQWITFPRFVLSGGFARAWRGRDASTPARPFTADRARAKP